MRRGFLWLENVSCPEMPGAGCTERLGTGFTLKMSSSSSPAARDPVGLNSFFLLLSFSQVMETKDMLYIVTEYAKNGEMFGEFSFPTEFLSLVERNVG